MNESPPVVRVSPLRQHVIDDMNVRRFCPRDPTQRFTRRTKTILLIERLYFR